MSIRDRTTYFRAGQRVRVQGGAGGVGRIVVQLARARGAEVFATASSDKSSIVTALGATFIDYEREAVKQYVEKHISTER